jgi:hypothetical protein
MHSFYIAKIHSEVLSDSRIPFRKCNSVSVGLGIYSSQSSAADGRWLDRTINRDTIQKTYLNRPAGLKW